jgi:hypothetical protein
MVEDLVNGSGERITVPIAESRQVGTVDRLDDLLNERRLDALYFSKDTDFFLVFFAKDCGHGGGGSGWNDQWAREDGSYERYGGE